MVVDSDSRSFLSPLKFNTQSSRSKITDQFDSPAPLSAFVSLLFKKLRALDVGCGARPRDDASLSRRFFSALATARVGAAVNALLALAQSRLT